MSRKIRVAVAGYGNLGKYAVEAISFESDMELCGVIEYGMDINNFLPLDVVLLCVPSLKVADIATSYLLRGINTIDSFDLHGEEAWKHRMKLDIVAKNGNSVALTSAGWDPGIDSVIRTIFKLAIPKGITYTNFGPGMSLGHSVAARSISGIKDAVSLTYPLGSGTHRRIVYAVLEEGADREKVKKDIVCHSYFCSNDVIVNFVKDLSSVGDYGHSAHIERKGIAGNTHNQKMSFSTSLNNPAVTSQVMIMSARAAMKRMPGAYTMLEIPPMDFFIEPLKDLIVKLV